MDVQQEMSLADLLGMFRRRGKLMVAVAGGVLLAIYWIAMALPNRYTASALILVEPQSIDETLVAAGVRESDLSARLGIMTSEIISRARLSVIISDLNLYSDESEWHTREEVVAMMRADLSVAPVLSELESAPRGGKIDKFSTFEISYSADTSTIAAIVANRLANDYIEEHIGERVKVSQKSLDFMHSAIDDLGRRIAVVEANVAEVKEQNPGRLPENFQANQQAYSQQTAGLGFVRRQLSTAKSDEAFWKSQVIAAVSLTSPNDPTDPVYRRKVLDMELADLLARGFTEKHPDVIKIRSELAVFSTRIKDAEKAGETEEFEASSYAEQNAKSEQRRAALRVVTLTEEAKRLEVVLEGIAERIRATPEVAEKLEALKREHDHLNASFQDFSARLQQAQVQADLERRQMGEQLRILEPAFAPTQPTSPNRILILVIGVVLGAGLGLAAALAVELGDSSLHSGRSLQAVMGIPVLAAVPTIVLEADRAVRVKRLVRESLVAAAIVLFCLAGGALTYVYVNGLGGFTESGTQEPTKEAERGADTAALMATWRAPRG